MPKAWLILGDKQDFHAETAGGKRREKTMRWQYQFMSQSVSVGNFRAGVYLAVDLMIKKPQV